VKVSRETYPRTEIAPKGIPHREVKRDYFLEVCKRNLFAGTNGICQVAVDERKMGHFPVCLPVQELHHAGVHESKLNRSLYPNLVHSVINIFGLSKKHHTERPHYGKMTRVEADKWERFLSQKHHRKICTWVNTLTWPV